ncbi:MAG: hypothetical protein MUE46_07415 [Xanthomonadales bacterium]|nr:hypothetical protein [Xanthomonadales bacterium]
MLAGLLIGLLAVYAVFCLLLFLLQPGLRIWRLCPMPTTTTSRGTRGIGSC